VTLTVAKVTALFASRRRRARSGLLFVAGLARRDSMVRVQDARPFRLAADDRALWSDWRSVGHVDSRRVRCLAFHSWNLTSLVAISSALSPNSVLGSDGPSVGYMTKRQSGFVVFVLIAVAAFAAAVSLFVERSRYPYYFAGLTPVRVSLADTRGSDVVASFEAVWSEPHYVAVIFRASRSAPEVDALVERAKRDVGQQDRAGVVPSMRISGTRGPDGVG
jgi:hypothetical protein